LIGIARNDWNLHDPTDPESCVLLNCLPVTCADYVKDYDLWPEYDFVRSVARDRSPESAWEAHGADLAKLVGFLLETAGSSRMEVVSRANKSDFARAFSHACKVVIFVAHWRGSRLVGRDLLAEPEEVVALVNKADPPNIGRQTLETIRDRFSRALADIAQIRSANERQQHFASRLNEYIIQAPTILPGVLGLNTNELLVIGDIWLETLHRDILDTCSSPLVLPGNRVELGDGLHSTSSLIELIPDHWSGLIDLTMCRSAIFGHQIKRGRSDRGILFRNRTVDPMVALIILKSLLGDIGTCRFNYGARYIECFRAATDLVREISVKSN
jgi:hypothetical protein